MPRTIVLLALLVVFSILLANDGPQSDEEWMVWRDYHTRADSAHGFDVLSYDLDITIDDAQEWIGGTCTATVVNEQTLTTIDFELEQLTVTSVRVNGATATYTYDDHVISITLPAIPVGQNYTIAIDYEGYPSLSNDVYSEGLFFLGGYVFTLSDPSGVRWWMPAYDHPWDKAEIDFTVTTRSDWTVACNGLRTGIVDNGNGTSTTTWDGSNPIAPHLFVIHAGPFLEIAQNYDDLPILNFSPQSYYNISVEDFTNLPFMIETFEDMFGPYPFEKYGNVVLGMMTFGAMEHQTMTTMGSSILDGQHGGERIVAHELAHQWYGNCLTPLTWKDVWLSEGFATYSEALYTQAWLGWEESVEYVRTEIMNYYKNWAGGQQYTIYDPSYNNYFSPPVYEKAASVLHMLRLEVGDDAFFDILQTWFQTYHNGFVITQEFQDLCEQMSGDDLSWFFEQWIYGEGTPEAEFVFYFNENDPQQFVCMAQTDGNGDTEFTLSVPIVFENAAGQRDSVVVRALSSWFENEYTAPYADWTSYEIDPNSWVLSRWNGELFPELDEANALDGEVLLDWAPFIDSSVNSYNVYRADTPEGPYSRRNDVLLTQSLFTDSGVVNGQTYYYRITAVMDDVFETAMSNTVAATPLEFPMDRGVLLVDETFDGNGATPISPTDVMVDDYYQQVVNNLYRQWDYATEGAPPIDTLACYSTVLWIDDDVSQHYIDDNLSVLRNYTAAGGHLLISGWKTAQGIPNSFYEDQLMVAPPQLWTESLFASAFSEEYQNLGVDESKMLPNWNGRLAYVCTFPNDDNPMFVFQGEGAPVDQSCALRRESANDGGFYLLGFPLYFMQAGDVENFMDQLLTEFGEELSVTPDPQPEMSLAMWPNPLRAGGAPLNVRFSLPAQGEVEAAVYNIRGQRVATLAGGKLPAGAHSLTWDMRNDTGAQVASGVYLLHVKHPQGEQARKILLLR